MSATAEIQNTPDAVTTVTDAQAPATITPPHDVLIAINEIVKRQRELQIESQILAAQADAHLFKGMAKLGLDPDKHGFDFNTMSYGVIQGKA